MKLKAPGFYVMTALGESMFIRPGDLLAIRKGRFHARPARVERALKRPGDRKNYFVGLLYDEHKEPHARPRVLKGADVLGYWQ